MNMISIDLTVTADAIITIVGSFIIGIGIFYIRQWIQKRRLRRAIVTELSQTEFLDQAVETKETPVNDFLRTEVLESNLDSLGYFRSQDIEHLISYHNSAKRMKNAIVLYRTPKDEFQNKPDNLANIIQGEAEMAREYRDKILKAWGKNPEQLFENRTPSNMET